MKNKLKVFLNNKLNKNFIRFLKSFNNYFYSKVKLEIFI